MKVVYTAEALRDLDDILGFVAATFPEVSVPLQDRLRAVERWIGAWPESAQETLDRPGVRVVPLRRYPYKVFYRISAGRVEILHIHHGARQQPPHS